MTTSNKVWRTFTLGCASAASHQTSCQKLKFNVPISQVFKHDCIPDPMLDLLKYISQEGVTVPDIFRRPGNPADLRKLIKRLNEGRPVRFAEYNFYTLASVIKRFLLGIPGGVFGMELEQKLLKVLDINNQLQQFDRIHELLSTLPKSVQRFLALLFGVWFRIVNHIEFHSMSSEAMAKSVTGSIFQNSTGDPTLVNKAAKVMQTLIENYAIPSVFGADNLQYFADVTCSGIVVTERFTFHYKFPSQQIIEREASLKSFAQHLRKECSSRGLLVEDELPQGEKRGAASSTPSPLLPSQARGGIMGCMSVPDVNIHNKFKSRSSLHSSSYLDRHMSKSLTKFDNVRLKQMARLKKRSDWFLNSRSPQQNRKMTLTSESEDSEHFHADEQKSEVESVFDDRRSIDTTLIDKPVYEEDSEYSSQNIISCDQTPVRQSYLERIKTDCNDNSGIVTKHFIKHTTIVPRKTGIPC